MMTVLYPDNNTIDCPAYLHGLSASKKEYISCLAASALGRDYVGSERKGRIRYKSGAVRNWAELLREEMNAGVIRNKPERSVEIPKILRGEENKGKSSMEDELHKEIDGNEIIVPPPSQFAAKHEDLRQVSAARNPNSRLYYGGPAGYMCQNPASWGSLKPIKSLRNFGKSSTQSGKFYDDYQSPQCWDLKLHAAAKTTETPKTARRGMSEVEFQSFVEEQLIGFGDSNEKHENHGKVSRRVRVRKSSPPPKRWNKTGTGVGILDRQHHLPHEPHMIPKDQNKVFLGGIPLHLTPAMLKAKLEDQGLTVLNKPKIKRGYAPEVCLGSAEEAMKLIAQRFILVDGHRIDVRLYQSRHQLRKGFVSVAKRSVFLGGLPSTTTSEMIIADLERLDVTVAEVPVIKKGFAPRVILESSKDAELLVSLQRIFINGTVVDVRPYVDCRKRCITEETA